MGMVLDRIGLLLRRGLAWWIDAFMAAAVIVVARWAINARADAPLTGQALEVYNAVALSLVFMPTAYGRSARERFMARRLSAFTNIMRRWYIGLCAMVVAPRLRSRAGRRRHWGPQRGAAMA